MSQSLDRDLRAALFAYVQRLCDASGGVVLGRDLDKGLEFAGQRIPIWNRQLGIFRPAVLRDVGAALTIQTAFNGPYDDRWSPDDDRFAYRYRGTDVDHNDNRAMRRAMELQVPLLYLVGLKPGVFKPVFPSYVVGDDPGSLTFFLITDVEGLVSRTAMDPQADWPRKAYVTREVKRRLHQDRFRYMVIGAYQERCAMCRLRHVELLDAAHIIEDRDERGMPEVPNGLALCRIHHGAYDVGILGVDPDYRIHVRRDVLEEHDGPMLLHGLQGLDKASLHTPRRPENRPNKDYLQVRFEKFQAA